MLLTSGTAQAADCRERVRNEEWKLQRDVNRHGFFSRQARHDRQRIAELREGCRVNHGWRDRDDRRWRRGDGDNDRDDRRWRRGDGDNDRDDRRWRRDGDHDRDDRGRHWHHRDRD
jgi:hypothetical protein